MKQTTSAEHGLHKFDEILGIFYSKLMDHVFALYVNKSLLNNLLLGTAFALLS